MTQQTNDHLVLVSGKSTTGKSASLMGLEDQTGVWYAGCEAGKKLPFKSKMREFTITDPYQVYEMFEAAEQHPEVHTLVVDTLTYLMDMFESIYVLGSSDTQKAWGEFAQYYKRLMQKHVAGSSKNVVFLAHTADVLNKSEMAMESCVPVKGSLAKNGIESYFSCVVSTKRMTLKDLKDFQSPLLTLTDEDQILGFKHVFQTRLTKDTVGERIRSPLGMWERNETFIDNNIQLVMERLRTYYQ